MKSLCIPFNFIERAEGASAKSAETAWIATLLRLWLWWAEDGRGTRPFLNAKSTLQSQTPDELVLAIERAVQWNGTPGDFCRCAAQAGILVESADGLTLSDFSAHNPHLAPGYKTIQQRGQAIMIAKKKLKQIEKDAGRMHDHLLRSPELMFPSAAEATPEERRKSIALIMSLDAAAGRAVRSPAEYSASPSLLADALHVVRTFPDQITPVQRHLLANRDKPHIARDAAFILAHFADYCRHV